jgi:hypothetical protein
MADVANRSDPVERPSWRADRRVERRTVLMLIVLSAVPMVALGWLRLRLQLPQGDEPHYLIISQALQHGSLDVQRIYELGGYWAFHPEPLEPHVSPGPDGRALPLHSIGGPLLWLLPFAIFGRAGVIAFMIVLSLLIVLNVYWLTRQLGVDRALGFAVALAFAVGSPVLTYSSMSFVEPIGALACVYTLRVLQRDDPRRRDLLLASTGLGVLPWVHARFLLFPAVFLGFLLLRALREPAASRNRRLVAVVVPAAALQVGLAAYDALVWHSLSPAPNQVNAGEVPSLTDPGAALLGTLLDQEAGVLVNFPIFLLVLPGLLLSGAGHRALHLQVSAVAMPYTLIVCSFPTWSGAWSPPARFMAVLLPMLAGYVAIAVQRSRGVLPRVLLGVTALIGAGLSGVAVLTRDGGFSAQRGSSPTIELLDAWTGLDLTLVAPSSALGGQQLQFVAWLLAAAGITIWWTRRAQPAGDTARWRVPAVGDGRP